MNAAEYREYSKKAGIVNYILSQKTLDNITWLVHGSQEQRLESTRRRMTEAVPYFLEEDVQPNGSWKYEQKYRARCERARKILFSYLLGERRQN
jgi:hypothetical protein